jgi:DNA-binding beta-propeller fold protein YncE
MIDTTTGAVTTTTMALLNDIDITPAGQRILAASYAGIEVYDAVTLAHLSTVDVTPPDDYVTRIAVSPDGTRAYALVGPAGGYGRANLVSVIDTSTYSQIATISIPDSGDIAISPDGDTIYVTELDGRTTLIISADTNAVTGQFVTDQSTSGPQWVAEGVDGKVYVTDYSLRTLYVVNVGDTTPSNNVAPSPRAPTGTFDSASGTTTGNVNVVDQDGDSLRYYLLYPPSYGAVTLNAETGDYIYTPYLTDDGYNQPYQDGFQVVVTDGNYVTTATVSVQTFVDPWMFSW